MDLSIEGRGENAVFRNIRAYLGRHSDLEKRARKYLVENPGASRSDMAALGFGGVMTAVSSINSLKEYFGIDRDYFNLKNGRMKDSELESRYELFRDFVQKTEGRFTPRDLPKSANGMLGRKYNDQIYPAVFDVCRAGNEHYESVDFIPFANYTVQLFLMRSALFAREQEREDLESGAYEGLLKADSHIDFSNSSQMCANYLLTSCLRGIEREDNFIGNLSKNSLRLGRMRNVLKHRLAKANYDGDAIDAEFVEHSFSLEVVHRGLRSFFDRPRIVSLDEFAESELGNDGLIFQGGEFKEIIGTNESLRVSEELELVDSVISAIPPINKRKNFKGVPKDRNRNVFVMKALAGKTFEEIAKHYGFTHQRAEQIYTEVCDCLKRKVAKVLL